MTQRLNPSDRSTRDAPGSKDEACPVPIADNSWADMGYHGNSWASTRTHAHATPEDAHKPHHTTEALRKGFGRVKERWRRSSNLVGCIDGEDLKESAQQMTDANFTRGMAGLWSDLAHVGSRKCLGHRPVGPFLEKLGLTKETAANFVRKDQEHFWSEAGECLLELAAFFVFNRAMVESAIIEHKAIVRRLRCRQDVDSVLRLFATRWFPEEHFAIPLIRTLYGDANWKPVTPDEAEWLKDYPAVVARFNATTGIEWSDFPKGL